MAATGRLAIQYILAEETEDRPPRVRVRCGCCCCCGWRSPGCASLHQPLGVEIMRVRSPAIPHWWRVAPHLARLPCSWRSFLVAWTTDHSGCVVCSRNRPNKPRRRQTAV
jgi:hypothetical protein